MSSQARSLLPKTSPTSGAAENATSLASSRLYTVTHQRTQPLEIVACTDLSFVSCNDPGLLTGRTHLPSGTWDRIVLGPPPQIVATGKHALSDEWRL